MIRIRKEAEAKGDNTYAEDAEMVGNELADQFKR